MFSHNNQMVSEFAAFLRRPEVQVKLSIALHSILEKNNVSFISRIFNGINHPTSANTHYEPVQALLNNLSDSLCQSEPRLNDWVRSAISQALDDLFDNENNIKNDVADALNEIKIENTGALDKLYQQFIDKEAVNKQLLSSYVVSLINEETPELIKALCTTSIEQSLAEDFPNDWVIVEREHLIDEQSSEPESSKTKYSLALNRTLINEVMAKKSIEEIREEFAAQSRASNRFRESR